jgi:putative oxidoreductase
MAYATTAPVSSSTAGTTPMQDIFALVGRILIALLFVPSGWGKIAGFAGTVGYIASKGVPLPEVCAAIAVAAELGLGLLILVGWQARWAALLLAVFTFVISFIFHNYWGVPAEQMGMQRINFYKNLAITGGLLTIAAFGAGAFSLDGRRRG